MLGLRPYIRWNFTDPRQHLWLPGPLIEPKSWAKKRGGGGGIGVPALAETFMEFGTSHFLTGKVAHIPTVFEFDKLGLPVTGWDDGYGWRSFFELHRQQDVIYFHPDSRNRLLYPSLGVDSDANGVVDGWSFVNQNTGAASFDSTNKAQVITVTNSTGAVSATLIQQTIPVTAGENVIASVDAMIDAPITNGTAAIRLAKLNSSFAEIGSTDSTTITSTSFSRWFRDYVVEAGVAYLAVQFRIRSGAAGCSGTARFKNAAFRTVMNRGYDQTYVDNPFYAAYLVAPRVERPELDPASRRRSLQLTLRSSTDVPLSENY